MEPEQVKRYMENDIIEIVPLAYMRGRTLNQAVIILDEGQNTTVPQMKMFLTRMGNGSKIIVTGDVTQVDLPKQTRSGLIDAVHRLRDMDRHCHRLSRRTRHRPPPVGAARSCGLTRKTSPGKKRSDSSSGTPKVACLAGICRQPDL